jgi:hypothetical protein
MYRSLPSPAPGLEVGANLAKSVQNRLKTSRGRLLVPFSGLRSVSPDFQSGAKSNDARRLFILFKHPLT